MLKYITKKISFFSYEELNQTNGLAHSEILFMKSLIHVSLNITCGDENGDISSAIKLVFFDILKVNISKIP